MSATAVAVIQLSSQEDVGANLARARRWIDEAASAGAKLVALPENFAFMGEEASKCAIAEPLGDADRGPILTALREAAAKAKVFLVAGGMPERSDDAERPFNTSLLLGPDGRTLASYRKIHLFDVDLPDGTKLEESRATRAGPPHGDNLVVATAAGLELGMTVCYDLRFPELYRRLVDKGARAITVPAAFTLMTGKDHWHVLLRARAIENQVFIIAPAQTGTHPKGRKTYGKSLIIDPWGDVLAQCGEGEGFALARLDLAYQERVRGGLPCLTHRKIEHP